jgi:hypothetical protein
MLRTIYLLSAYTIFAPSIYASDNYCTSTEAAQLNQQMNMVAERTILGGEINDIFKISAGQRYGFIKAENCNTINSSLKKLFLSKSLQILTSLSLPNSLVDNLSELDQISNVIYSHTTQDAQRCYIAIWKIGLNYELFQRNMLNHIRRASLQFYCYYLGNFLEEGCSVNPPYCLLPSSAIQIIQMYDAFDIFLNDAEKSAVKYLKARAPKPGVLLSAN